MPSARASAGVKAPKLGGGSVNLDAAAFQSRFNMPLVHQAVRAELNARRRGTASTKTRGEVSGGGAKPWRQKGTGRARAGSSRSPLWAGGGTTFGPHPRHYTFKINRKERRAALRSALSLHAERESMAVFDGGAFTAPSTAQAVKLLNDWDPAEPVLVVLGAEEADAGKSFRNIARTDAVPVEDVGVADLIGAASLLVSEAALTTLTARANSADASPSEAPRVPKADRKKTASDASASDADTSSAEAPAGEAAAGEAAADDTEESA